MYESYTRQSLPTKQYRELLGSAICVFNSNNAFIIENILKCDDLDKYDWYHLIDLESGHLKGSVHEVITSKCGDKIETLLSKLLKCGIELFIAIALQTHLANRYWRQKKE